ncbi:MAG: DNA polymerase beta superfamily protein [Verrucomicrobiales bacterium]
MICPFETIAAGTQVVVGKEVLGAHHALVHPRGAVGIITRTPAIVGENYLIRFPDGFEATFEKEEFTILKHFKDRLPNDPSSETFALENYVIYRCVIGSRAYGLDTETSDTDLRGVYIAPAEMHWSLYGAPEQFEDNAGQWCLWELQKFVLMALKANPNILECLYSPLVEKVSTLGEGLLNIRKAFLSQMIFQTFSGYAMSQFKKIEQDRRNQGEIKWKHAMHLLRLLITGAGALREGRVPVRLTSHKDRLLAVKNGHLDWAEVDEWRLSLYQDFERAFKRTLLPERPDYASANQFLIHARKHQASGF